MTTYTLEVDSSNREFTSLEFEIMDSKDPGTWSAILADVSEAVSKGDAVNIKRDGTTTFSGVVETIDPIMAAGGATKRVGGRHTKVKLWRKYSERYSEDLGFWTNFYPNKIVKFLLEPSFSDYDPDNSYTRVGWGIDPVPWTITSVKAAGGTNDLNASHGAVKLKNRIDNVGFRSLTNQTSGDYIQVDLGSSTTICAIRLTNYTLDREEFIRNYKIETSTTGAWGGEEVEVISSVTDNKGMNIVETWTPAETRYIRIECTGSFADKWSASNIFVYESAGSITGISVGTITEHLPFNVSAMAANASSGQADITVDDGWKFSGRYNDAANKGDEVIIMDDDAEEYGIVKSISGDVITLENNLSNSYTTAKSGAVINYSIESSMDLEYSRRSESINKIVKMCSTSDIPWVWRVQNDGTVDMAAQYGSDLSGSISFVYGTNIVQDHISIDARQQVDKVLVIGKGTGNTQDKTRSGWQGSGDYESVVIDRTLETVEATRAKAEQILVAQSAGKVVETIVVKDTNTTNDWGVDDNITLTDALTGLSGAYLVKGVKRQYSAGGEIVTINTTSGKITPAKMIAGLQNAAAIQAMQLEEPSPSEVFVEVIDDPLYMFKYEAEGMVLDSDVTTEIDLLASNKRYIQMASANNGDVVNGGPGITLEAGNYRVIFCSKVTSNASSSDIVTLAIYSSERGSNFNALTIAPDDYNSGATFETISFTFRVLQKRTDIEFIINAFQTGITDWCCDFMAIQANWIVDDPPGPPTAPANPVATSVLAAVLVEWDENSDTDLDYYIIYRDETATATTELVRVRTNVYLDGNVTADTIYYYRMKAVDWTGNISDYSSEVNGESTEIGALDLDIEMRPWSTDLGFTYDTGTPDRDHLYWGLGGDEANTDATISFDGGTSTGVNKGNNNFNPGADTVYYFYWDETQKTSTKYDVQYSITYSDATGSGKGLLAVIKIFNGNVAGDEPTVLPFNGYIPTISGGVIAANTIIAGHIKADTITATQMAADSITTTELNVVGIDGATGKIKLTQIATGNLDNIDQGTSYKKVLATEMSAGYIKLTTAQDMDAQGLSIVSNAGTTRVEVTSTHIAGYDSNVLQFELLASDGKAMFGAGVGFIDASGIYVKQDALTTGAFETGMFRLYDAIGTDFYGALLAANLGAGEVGIALVADTGHDVIVYATPTDTAYLVGGDVLIGATQAAAAGNVGITATQNISSVAAIDVTLTATAGDVTLTAGDDLLFAPTGVISLQANVVPVSSTVTPLGGPAATFRYFVPRSVIASRPTAEYAAVGLFWATREADPNDKEILWWCAQNDASGYEWVQIGITT